MKTTLASTSNDAPNRPWRIWRARPDIFVEDVLLDDKSYVLEDYQRESLKALGRGEDLTIRGCHGSGKTFLDACALVWFMTVWPKPRVIATAPKLGQLKTRLWPEIKKVFRDTWLEDHFTWYKTRFEANDYPEQSFATAEASSDPDNISGIHEGYVLVIVDEAQGVDEEIYEALEGSRTNENAQLILSGNPVHRTGTFFESFHSLRDLYHTVKVSFEDTTLVDDSFRERIARKYGENSPVYKVRVLAEFPENLDEYFISLSNVEDAKNRTVDREETAPLDIGLDVGGRESTGDESVVIARQGGKVLDMKTTRGKDTNEVSGWAKRFAEHWKEKTGADEVRIKVDDTGLGQGVTDTLSKQFKNTKSVKVFGIKGGEKPSERGKSEYRYKADEMWGILRDRFKDGTIEIPDDKNLIAQLSTRPFSLLDSGKVKLTPKRKMEKSNEFESPDRADALALAFYSRELYSGNTEVSVSVA